MRTALFAALAVVLVAPLAAFLQSSRTPSRAQIEREVNQRLDRQLHVTLQKLIANQTARLDASSSADSLLTRR